MEKRTTSLFFDEDEVVLRSGNTIKCGTVIESYADAFSEDENSSDDESDLIKPGKVRVAFYPTGQESLVDESKLELVERSLMPGDIVRKNATLGQKGYVTECNVICWLQVKGTNQILSKVNSKLLDDPYTYSNESIYVELDGWIGRSEVTDECSVTVMLPDGSKITVNSEKLDQFDDVFDVALRKKDNSEFAFTNHYVGQKMKGPLKCIKKSEKSKRTVTVTVTEVTVKMVRVNWLYSGLSDSCAHPNALLNPHPKKEVTGEKLQRLTPIDPFVHATAQLGDTFYYTMRDEDRMETITTKGKATVTQHLILRLLAGQTTPGDQRTAEPSSCVQPTDDSDEARSEEHQCDMAAGGEGADADSLVGGASGDDWEDLDLSTPSHRPDRAVKARRGNRKKTRTSSRNNNVRSREPGLVSQQYQPGTQIPVEVVLSESFVDIMWQDGTFEKNISSRELYSVYHLDDNEFFPGDYVTRADADEVSPNEYGVVISVDESQRIANIKWFSTSGTSPTCMIEAAEVSVYEIKDHASYKFRPGAAVLRTLFDNQEEMQCCTDDVVGSVIQLHCDGLMSIKWADGCVSQCYPEQLLLVGNMHESDDEDSSDGDDESDISSADFNDGSDIVTDDGDDGDDEADHNKDENSIESSAADLKDIGCAISELLVNYERVLESIKDIQQSRIQLPWCDFSNILSKLSSAPVLYRKMLKLDHSLKLALVARISKEELWDLERSMKKATSYGSMISSMKTLSALLTDEEKTATREDIQTFLAIILRGLEGLPCAESEEEAEFIVSVVSLVHRVQRLDVKMFGGEVENDDNMNNGDGAAQLRDKCEMAATEACHKHDDIIFPSEEDSNSNSTTAESKSLLVSYITEKVSQLDTSSKSSVQLEIIDSVTQFFYHMKEVTATVLEVYNSQYSSLTGASSFEHKSENAEIVKPELTESQEPLIKWESNEDISLKQEVCTNCVDNTTSNDDSSVPSTHNIKTEIKSELGESDLPSAYDITDKFIMLPACPLSHQFFHKPANNQGTFSRNFIKCVQSQLRTVSQNLPDGIYVRAFEDRLDCLSAMVIGPSQTPYEDAIFTFDINLPADYPHKPPVLYYHSYSSDRLNPNLYVDGKVCVSLLGTWSGKQHELWNPYSSNLLQVLISIQGLILVSEPYYNEAGYDKQRETVEGNENSKKYNEMVHIKVLQSMIEMLDRPHESFRSEIDHHWTHNGRRFLDRIANLVSEPSSTAPSGSSIPSQPIPATENSDGDPQSKVCRLDQHSSCDPSLASSSQQLPDYPLLPLSKGCMLTIRKLVEKLRDILKVRKLTL